MKGAFFKAREDPRVNRVWKFLRRTSLDELPQFWNVLRGGDEPGVDAHTEAGRGFPVRVTAPQADLHQAGNYRLWQVGGRNDIREFNEVVRLDVEYIDKWNLWLDLKILVKTFRVLFAHNGAY